METRETRGTGETMPPLRRHNNFRFTLRALHVHENKVTYTRGCAQQAARIATGYKVRLSPKSTHAGEDWVPGCREVGVQVPRWPLERALLVVSVDEPIVRLSMAVHDAVLPFGHPLASSADGPVHVGRRARLSGRDGVGWGSLSVCDSQEGASRASQRGSPRAAPREASPGHRCRTTPRAQPRRSRRLAGPLCALPASPALFAPLAR